MFHLIKRIGLQVEISDELWLMPEFVALLEKHKNMKSYATEKDALTGLLREVTYMFMYIDYRSPFDGLDDDKRHDNAIFNSRLPEGWVKDKTVAACMVAYRKVMYDVLPTVKSLRTSRRGLTSVNDLLEDLVREIEIRRKMLQGIRERVPVKVVDGQTKFKRMEKEEKEVVDSIDTKAILDESISYITKFMSLLDKVPDAILTIEKALSQVAKEESEAKPLRGGGKKGSREDPERYG